MNPRILKKLSKRADPIVSQLTNKTRFVTSEKNGMSGPESMQCVEKKYHERWRGKLNEHGYFIVLDGTVGYGEMSGYYEPEWEDIDAYSLLQKMVRNHFTSWENFNPDSGEFQNLA